jgi:hypothetical protein
LLQEVATPASNNAAPKIAITFFIIIGFSFTPAKIQFFLTM